MMKKLPLIGIAIAGVVALWLFLVLSGIVYMSFLPIGIGYAKYAEVRLLCKTDYRALLDASRELSQRAGQLGLKPEEHYRIRFGRCTQAANFPKPILALGPSYVFVRSDGSVGIEMLGGLGHCGVRAYPEGFRAPYPNFWFGDKELIPGLWYYDDGYKDSPDHRKRIDSLIERGEKLQGVEKGQPSE
jgi:hypothetical protein